MKRNNRHANIIFNVIMISLIILVFIIYGILGTADKNYKAENNVNNQNSSSHNGAVSSFSDKEDKPNNSNSAIPYNINDPLSLSFTDSSYLVESKIRNRLSGSELEYCSHFIRNADGSYTITWNLADDEKEVYKCTYTYDKKAYKDASKAACSLSDGYEEYRNGNKRLIRDYVMPEKDDGIDMWVYENGSSYYDEHFILGKNSDMECYVKGEDIFFTYYWYQNTDDGPVLVYKSTAKNTDTTSGSRYNESLWDLFEESYRNIDIIPYKEFPRDYDYFEVYKEWKNKDRKKKEEERLKEKIEIYCECQDEEELYSEYFEDFDSWEDAADFWEENCK